MIPLPPVKAGRAFGPRDGGADVRSGKAGVRLSSAFTGFTGAHAGVSRQRTARPRLGEGFAQPPWGCWLKLPFALSFGPEIPAAAPQHARLAARLSEGAAIAFPLQWREARGWATYAVSPYDLFTFHQNQSALRVAQGSARSPTLMYCPRRRCLYAP